MQITTKYVTTSPSNKSRNRPHQARAPDPALPAVAIYKYFTGGGFHQTSGFNNRHRSLFWRCPVSIISVSYLSRAAMSPTRFIPTLSFRDMVNWSPCPISDSEERVQYSAMFCIICFTLLFHFVFKFMFCIVYVTLTSKQHTSTAECVVQQAVYVFFHACRPPAGRNASPRAFGVWSALYCYRTLLLYSIDFLFIRPCDL